MIAYLQGELLLHEPQGHADLLILLVAGVGYQVITPVGNVQAEPGQAVSLWIHSITREDGTRLYGFAERASIQGFIRLLDISGVGAKVAIALFSAHGWQGVVQLISAGNVTALTQADGVGKKIAQRIIHELSPKIADLSAMATASLSSTSRSSAAQGSTGSATQGSHAANAVSALCNLGYHTAQAQQAVQAAVADDHSDSLEGLITAALQRLSQG